MIGPFCANYITFNLKKYRGVIIHDTEVSFKIWRKTYLRFGKCHEKFCKFLPEHLETSKLGLWWDPFVQTRKYMTWKITEELCVWMMKRMMKSFKRKWLVSSKSTLEIDKFWLEDLKISKICPLMGCFWQSI